MTIRSPFSGDARAYLQEVKRGVLEALRDIKSTGRRDNLTLSVIDSLKDAKALLAATLAAPSSNRGHSDCESGPATILRTAEALADHAAILRESHPVESISLQLTGLALVRSLHTIVQVNNDDNQLGPSLHLFDELPHREISSWLKDRIARARMMLNEQLQPAPIPTALSA